MFWRNYLFYIIYSNIIYSFRNFFNIVYKFVNGFINIKKTNLKNYKGEEYILKMFIYYACDLKNV